MDNLQEQTLGTVLALLLDVLSAKEAARGEQLTVDIMAEALGRMVGDGSVAQFNFEVLDSDQKASIKKALNYIRGIQALAAARSQQSATNAETPD
jgi:hypothetical protein